MTRQVVDSMLAEARTEGICVFFLPPVDDCYGMAFCGEDGGAYVNIFGFDCTATLAFALAHEIAHHRSEDTTRWTSSPTWEEEYQADQVALEILKSHGADAQTIAGCEKMARRHIRPLLQPMIDAEIWHHVDEDVARWAGCDLRAALRQAEGGE